MATQVISLTETAVDLVTAPPVDLVRGEKYTLQVVIGPAAYYSEGPGTPRQTGTASSATRLTR